MKALLIVDVQNDFCPGGALPAPEGDQVVSVINRIMPLFNLVITSRDWHPANSVHFEKWPSHCVAKSPGADYHPDLDRSRFDLELLKGTRDSDDGYSAFEATNIHLGAFLRQKNVDQLFVTGLTTEYCVKNTVLDALDYGFSTFVVTDAVKGVNARPGDHEKALKEMEEAGAHLILSSEIPDDTCN
ncbi:MAG: isochorismatase family protein [Bacteroidales bacterium]